MGGKHKPAQRIKNNARPSSSGRSAELLASSSQVPQFAAVKEIRFVPPTLSLLKTEEFDSSVSPAFQIVFKKMNKKDCTTKLKALQEFCDLIASSEAEAVKTILAFWATLYSILATDTDHRVREAVHNAHHQIILKDKKMIAPFLKQLIGPWFTSQYDNYPPAATAASKAFNAAFPQNKVQDCVVFCQKEILTYIYDNLTSKIESNPKHGTNEDAEAKFERIIISSLQGYCLYLNTLTQEQIEKSEDLNKQIISNSRFLKLATHKTAQIRATWFKAVAILYQKAPFLLEEEHKNFVPVVFNNLDESEPPVVGSVWDAALLIMDLGQEWWKLINIEKSYLSKLKKVLREGGQGNATVIYPNLLSLLHKLPPSVRVDQFYDSFFENLRCGLKRKSVISSRSESTAVVAALVECLQYVILVNQENCDLCVKLIKSHLLPLIEWSLRAEQVCYRTVFHQIALLVQYWNRNKNLANYSEYLALFWSNVVTLVESVSKFEEENEDLVDRQIVFLQHLKTIAKPKEQLKVKFEEEARSESHLEGATQIDASYNENLTLLVYTLLKTYVVQIEENKSKVLIPNVYAVVRLFESREFLVGLSRSLYQSDNLVTVYDKLFEWLKSDELSCETLVDLAFILLNYVNDDEKNVILESFLQLSDRQLFGWCVKNAFSHPYNQDSSVQSWIKRSEVGRFLVSVADCNLKIDCPPDLKVLFKLAFAENEDGELLIDKNTLNQIIEKVRAPLLEPRSFEVAIDSCVHLASYITGTIYTENTLLKFGEDLLLALFQFSCNDHTDLEFLTDDTEWEVNTAWQDVVMIFAKNLPKNELQNLNGKFADLVEENFLGKFPTDVNTNCLIQTIVSFIKAVLNGQPFMASEVLRLFFERSFVPTWKNKIEDLCLQAEYLTGSLSRPENYKKETSQVSQEEILKYFVWSFIKISVLSSPLEEDEEENAPKDIIYVTDDQKQLIMDVLYDLTMCQSFLTNYKITKHYKNLSQYYDFIKEKTTQTLEKIQIGDEMTELFISQLNSNSGLWSKVIYLYNQEIFDKPPQETFKTYHNQTTSDLSQLHLVQLYGPHLDFDHVATSSVLNDVVILRSLAHCDEIDVQIAEIFEKIKKLRNRDIPKFLFENKERTCAESEVVIEVIRLFTRLIKVKFENLSRQHWDFGVISLASWASNCCKFRSGYDSGKNQAFMVAISEFYIALNEKINELKRNNVKSGFVDEWEELFLPNVHLDLVQLWLYLAEQFASKTCLLDYHPFLQEFGKVTDHFVYKLIFSKENTLPSWSKILKRCAVLLTNSTSILQLWGYKMLLILVPGLIEIDLQSDSSSTPNTKGFTIGQFKEILLQTHSIVDGVLAGFKLGEDSCQVTPFTDSYTYVFAYLLLWGVLLSMCEKSTPELRYQYADWFRNDDYFKSLLNNLFKLMPTEILHYSEGKTKAFSKLFSQNPGLGFKEPCTSEQLEHIVCWIYSFCLAQLPALVRQWWSQTETKVTQIVEKVTAFYVSPQLCNQELLDITQHENKFKNMTVKIVPSVREVIAVYTVDEAQMELVVTLPQNYPLGDPDVRCSRQIGGPLHKQWLMQLKKYLVHQNGRIWDGLSLWNSSLDKKFDGVEECYICFAVLHPGTYQLPKLTCQTCKKKFHSACLYKWFSTSNKSSCPICRNLF
ncbi:E3 ubiquitin-protein ligase listerin isoform X2 [Tribolium castaneum]|uniref:E3 ubiquitin-protein ligase listerin n=1 Tax=Tribolium castaneum TaxID=7070 RepID=D6X3R8_TRICA|nr:PREDICTED: E3 ubiquitin-protein ligase listerin isoform X2 [Tribolium castaneum]EEZ97459.2 E3 ubiquitin-protein ligase listerin-like Protein [Tribolium castaneum]|eukprot:XP_008197874.1 PREDICTED: E3 ubiquitin-protein ligase listerin isoform X2 [Tribolium castaneum]